LWLYGATTLSVAELIAIIVGTGTRTQNVYDLASSLLAKHPLAQLARLHAASLAKLAGIGEAKSTRIIAAFELGRRAVSTPMRRGHKLTSPDEVAAIYGPRLSGNPEHFIIVHVDTRCCVLAETLIGQGGFSRCTVSVREVFGAALELGAASLIAVHNHPSGDPEPSDEDIELTRRLAAAGDVVGVPVLDHVVVAGLRFVSLRQRGVITTNTHHQPTQTRNHSQRSM
jgi:DNA repair protein RadC